MSNTHSQRNADFMAAVRSQLKPGDSGCRSTAAVIDRVRQSPAPRFYVEYETAYKAVCRVLSHRSHPDFDRVRQCQWHDIALCVKHVRRRNPRMSVGRALVDVLELCPAPSYYLSHDRALKIYKHLSEK